MTAEDRVKMLIGDLMVTIQMLQTRIAELEKAVAEKQGPHEVKQAAK